VAAHVAQRLIYNSYINDNVYYLGIKLYSVPFQSSQVKKIYPPGFIEQGTTKPFCPVRGVVGCKRNSSSRSMSCLNFKNNVC